MEGLTSVVCTSVCFKKGLSLDILAKRCYTMECVSSAAGKFKSSCNSCLASIFSSQPLSAQKTEDEQTQPILSMCSFNAETIMRCRSPSLPCCCVASGSACSRSANLTLRCFLIQSLRPVSLRMPASVCLAFSSSSIRLCMLSYKCDDVIQLMIAEKWRVFLLTFTSYALIHSVRTAWSSLKYALNSAPYAFEPLFLGSLDMIVLIILAVSLNLFGPMIEKLGAKTFLQRGILFLAVIVALLGILLLGQVSSKLPYTILYPLVGFGSCVGWPACIFILSKYFQKGMAFSLWTGSSQFGDFIALIISYLIVEQAKLNPGVFLIFVSFLLVGMFYLNRHALPDEEEVVENLPPESPVENMPDHLVEEGDQPLSSSNMNEHGRHNTQAPVNFITVWKLPSVPGYILSFLFVKSVNAVVVTWLIFYLSMIGMKRESRIIAVLWAISTFFGGLLGSYFNPNFNKIIFIASLLASAILFVFLQQVHLYPSQTSVIILVLTCGLIFGGPFTLMSTSIPLLLSEKPQIRNIPGAKAAIVSAMQGYGLLFCGISLLVVPTVGVIHLHWLASLYCTISATILLYEHLKELNHELKEERHTKHLTEPNIDIHNHKEDGLNMTAPVALGNRPSKTRRRPKRKSNLQQPQGKRVETDNNAIKTEEDHDKPTTQQAKQFAVTYREVHSDRIQVKNEAVQAGEQIHKSDH